MMKFKVYVLLSVFVVAGKITCDTGSSGWINDLIALEPNTMGQTQFDYYVKYLGNEINALTGDINSAENNPVVSQLKGVLDSKTLSDATDLQSKGQSDLSAAQTKLLQYKSQYDQTVKNSYSQYKAAQDQYNQDIKLAADKLNKAKNQLSADLKSVEKMFNDSKSQVNSEIAAANRTLKSASEMIAKSKKNGANAKAPLSQSYVNILKKSVTELFSRITLITAALTSLKTNQIPGLKLSSQTAIKVIGEIDKLNSLLTRLNKRVSVLQSCIDTALSVNPTLNATLVTPAQSRVEQTPESTQKDQTLVTEQQSGTTTITEQQLIDGINNNLPPVSHVQFLSSPQTTQSTNNSSSSVVSTQDGQ